MIEIVIEIVIVIVIVTVATPCPACFPPSDAFG